MKKQNTYECEKCHKTADDVDNAPDCCGKVMNIAIDYCMTAPHAEMARYENDDDPCREE